jgi:hypothetical protein
MTKNISSPNVWSWKNFDCHTIGNGKISIFIGLAIEIFLSPNLQWPKKIRCNKFYGDRNGPNFDRP